MRGVQLIWPARAERWRRPAIVAASVTLHAVVLGYVAFRSMDLGPVFDPGPTIIEVQIEPRPLLPGEAAPVPSPPQRPLEETRVLSVPGSPVAKTLIFRDPRDEEDTPLTPAPRLSAAGAPAPPVDVGEAQWQVRPETRGDRVARSMRTGTVGCASPILLTAQERLLCDERFGQRAALAEAIGPAPSPARDEAFARQARANEAWRDYTRGEGAYPGLRSLFRER